MQIQPRTLAFTDFSHVLAQADMAINPSEVHGMLCGLICIGHKLSGKFWFDLVLNTMGVKSIMINREIIIELYDTTCRQLSGLEYEFELLLPEESKGFDERAIALSFWCRGFTYGLGIAGVTWPERVSEEVLDAIRCIGEIGKLDFAEIEVSENDKNAYGNVADFVRNSVIMMYAELMELPLDLAAISTEEISLH